MLNINLAKDCYKSVNGKEVLTNWYTDVELPCTKYTYKRPSGDDERPPISDVYDILVKAGYSGEEIIDKLIEIYVPLHYFHLKDFAKIQKVIGFIGPRGTGKSCSAVNVALFDWLLRGKPVWSNLAMGVRVFYKDASKEFRSERLETLDMLSMADENSDGLVLVDEINMSAAESTRSMSGANLEFSYAMQQIRKKRLSVIWTCQGWMWVDNRVRWQTDFVVACRDAYTEKKFDAKCPGDKSHWRVMDTSGLTGKFDFGYEEIHRYLYQFEVWEGCIWNKPIWHAFDTYERQGEESYIRVFKEQKALEGQIRRLELKEGREYPARELAENMRDREIDVFYAEELWKSNDITDPGMKAQIGRELKKFFDRHRDGHGKYFYERKVENLTN